MPFVELKVEILHGYGLHVDEMEKTSGGLDSSASTYRVSTSTGQKLFVKIRSTPEMGSALSSAMVMGGISAVLAPLKTTSGETVHQFECGFLLVYPLVEGQNGFDRPLELHHWEQLGSALRQIHAFPFAHEVTRETYTVSGIPAFIETMNRLLGSRPTTEVEVLLSTAMKIHEQVINHWIKSFEQASNTFRNRSDRLVVCHADIHVGNVLIDDTDTLHIIDWDSPKLAPRECDLMFVCDGGILNQHDHRAEEAFFRGYGQVKIDRTLIGYYRLARKMEDLESFTREAFNANLEVQDRLNAARWFVRQCSNFGP